MVTKSKTTCEVCKLDRGCKTPGMKYHGEGRKKILIIGDSPTRNDDDYGVPLVGESGSFLMNSLTHLGIDLNKDCWRTNAVKCFIPKGKKPTKRELRCCREKLVEEINVLNPMFIWLFGPSAIESFYMDKFSGLGITRWRGLCIPDPITNAWIFPMYHPSHVLQNIHDENLDAIFMMDLKKAVRGANRVERPAFPDLEKSVKLITKIEKVIKYLRYIKKEKPMIFFDYETTSLKPFNKGNRIWSISIAFDDDAIAFPLAYPWFEEEDQETISYLWGKILQDPKIKKVAHSLKFEDMWSRHIFGLDKVAGWENCTQATAHILDSRTKFTGLKFQSYINFGVYGYDKEIKSHLVPKDTKSINTVDQFPLNKLLLYNALDAKLTRMLYFKQQKTLRRKPELQRATEFFTEGLLTLSDTTMNGITIDPIYYMEIAKSLDEELESITKTITGGDEARKFKKIVGRDLQIKTKDISTKDLRDLFEKVLKVKSVKPTATGLMSTDVEVLNNIGIPIADAILRRRKLMKMRNTYVQQMFDWETEGKIYPFFDLHTVQTGRSSAANPSLLLVA